jgi:hypothetical protein
MWLLISTQRGVREPQCQNHRHTVMDTNSLSLKFHSHFIFEQCIPVVFINNHKYKCIFGIYSLTQLANLASCVRLYIPKIHLYLWFHSHAISLMYKITAWRSSCRKLCSPWLHRSIRLQTPTLLNNLYIHPSTTAAPLTKQLLRKVKIITQGINRVWSRCRHG